jgi:hypothetical protein
MNKRVEKIQDWFGVFAVGYFMATLYFVLDGEGATATATAVLTHTCFGVIKHLDKENK